MPNTYHTILCQALTVPVGLRVSHENPRSAIQRFRQEKAKAKDLFSCLRFFPSPVDPAEVWIVKDTSSCPNPTPSLEPEATSQSPASPCETST